MIAYVLGRLVQFLLSLLVASVAVFALMSVLPGNAAQVALGTNATAEAVAELESRYGLDEPALVRYLDWLGGMVRGDFGTSYVTGAPITPVIVDSVQVTAILVVAAIIVAVLIAVPLGTFAALEQRSWVGATISALSQIGIAIPSFLAAILLVMVFSLTLGWFPSQGWMAPIEGVGGFLARLVLPVVSLALVQAAILTRYVRSAVLDVMREDYIRTARAKGLTRTRALFRHGLRNAAIPVITVAGVQLATLLVGAVVIEQIFVLPGIGSELVRAVSNRDLVTVQGIVMVLIVLVLLINFVVDLLYPVVDPRLRAAA
ncbi:MULTISPECIES: ABC transporter permease [Brevibacterium]|uniref:ABC dipeptide/oligopeptide transporter permease n=3 Tax=Brevibacterium casei TaxID=33889 RepID=K9B2P7_9MICO|nr:ABC transporter permease [Brevibacterium casei]NJE66207.1 ABC transporter permease [Brevibacterium sp. LS14]SIJ03240.1 ABC-type dipeptide/oligopeptide/nickel transport system, permease component [Mycobacteroides abscessus subsp. abscessus]EKU49082.1 ABC dipeptide/oligopeptide transporter permease [Brevibacterium casei S18]KZE18391.1 ABC transporter permease [Brevibacterium casei]MBE4695976.1 ABC transporter permease [Brevibacterium casei]